MADSPIERFLAALERLDADAVLALSAPEVRLMLADGRRAGGSKEVRALVTGLLGELRRSSYRITGSWHVEDSWIAEAVATYELADQTVIGPLPRAFFLRAGPAGITDVRAYGAHEHPLAERRDAERGTWLGGHWIPPL